MTWYQRWRNVFRPTRLDDELDDELQYHLAETVDRLIADGHSESDAWREARRRLGHYALHKERTRDMNIVAWLDATRADLIYGLRQLRRNPGFAAMAIFSLALGIGANTAIFQLVNAIRFKPLPVQAPRELVSLTFEPGAMRAGSWSSRSAAFTYPEWEEVRARQQAFSGVLAWSATRFNLATGGEPRLAEGLYVSGDFFRVLGVDAILGRTLTAADDSETCSAGAVISYAFWQRALGGDPSIVGRTLALDGHQMPVIGVTPRLFFGVEVGRQYDIAIPFCADRLLADDHQGRRLQRTNWWLSLIGRLKPGWTLDRASADLRSMAPAVMRATLPTTYTPLTARRYLANTLRAEEAGAGLSRLRQDYERPLWLLMAITGLVLLIACANLANLLLARGAVRQPEIALRLAIGASRGRLVRQLLAESLLLAGIGAAGGILIAVAASDALIAFISTPAEPIFVNAGLDLRVLLFTAALAMLTCVFFGLMPALRATWLSPATAMRAGGRGMTAGRERVSLRRGLVVTQVAVSLVLLVGALLFVRSLQRLLTVDAGFQADGILIANIDFSRAPYPVERRQNVARELSDRLSAIRGVLSVAQISFTPMSGGVWDNLAAADGATAATSGKLANYNVAGPGYFRTMGTRLIAGREFNDRDTAASPKVAIVNEMFARTFFGSANPINHTFHVAADAGRPEPSFQIVGVVANSKYLELREDFRPIAFFPIAQEEHPAPSATFVIRMAGAPATVISDARTTVAAMSSVIGIELRPLSMELRNSLLRERLMATLSGAFGVLAGLLATFGLYGVIAYMVARRRNEIGVRMALGAGRAQVMRLVLREALLLLAIGVAIGVLLAWWASQAAATLLFGLQPHDSVSFVAASALLTIIALIASYAPARRAAALDPIVTLRHD